LQTRLLVGRDFTLTIKKQIFILSKSNNEKKQTVNYLCYCLDGAGIELVVKMLNLASVETTQLCGKVLALNVTLQIVDDSAYAGLILEPLDVLVTVSIAFFKDLDKFLVHALDCRQHAAVNAIETLCWIFFPFNFSLIKSFLFLL
jgi:hypothetical protein